MLTNYKAVADFGKRLYKTTTDAIQANDPDASYAAQYMDKRIRQIHRERCIDQETSFLAHKGVKAFWSSHSSVVEDAVLWRENQRERTAKAPEAGSQL